MIATHLIVELIRSTMGLRALQAVAEQGSFGAAAVALGVTQSAVSQHVAALERTTGIPLVVPRTRPVELTQAGHVLVAHCRAVQDRLAAAEHDLAEIAGARDARLRLGSFPTALATFVPDAIGRLGREMPGVALTVVDDHMQRLWPRLDRRELDVAIVFDDGRPDPALPAGFDLTGLFTDPYRLLLPRGHRLAGERRRVTLRDLKDETWIGGGSTSTWFRLIRQACQDNGFEPRTGVTSDDYLAVQAFVRAGLGIALVPGLATARRMAGIEARTLHGAAPRRRIGVAHVAGPYVPRAVSLLVDILPAVTRRWDSP
jgi:DNA-binding transcriptional LysR family regulator